MKSVTGENYKEKILYVSKIPKEISVDLLSDADFSEVITDIGDTFSFFLHHS